MATRESLSTAQELRDELTLKRERVQELLRERKLDAILIARHENIAWLTGGQAEVRVGLLRETGAASLLVTSDDRVICLTTNNEAPRLEAEEFGGLGYEMVVQPWLAADVGAAVRAVVSGGKVASDAPQGAMPVVALNALRAELTGAEVERYRWLGGAVAEIATEVLEWMRPGVTEREVQASLGERLMAQEILPAVYLDAFDERVRGFRHAVPRAGVLKKLGMLGFCARRWGLSVSMTRFVHFGAMPAELEEKFAVVAEVNARLLAATRVGASGDELFHVAHIAYAELGFAGEETMHHQGGATGYLEREWVTRPGSTDRVTMPQAFAWNPNVQGAKVEDTSLLIDGGIETLTATAGLPVVKTLSGGVEYRSAGVLVR